MAQFRYEGMASDGKTVKGVIEAQSEAEASVQLRGSGLFVLSCTPVRDSQQESRPRGETFKKHDFAESGSIDSDHRRSGTGCVVLIGLAVVLLGCLLYWFFR